jgi:hypothetical protein
MTKHTSPCHTNQGRDYKEEAILRYLKSPSILSDKANYYTSFYDVMNCPITFIETAITIAEVSNLSAILPACH